MNRQLNAVLPHRESLYLCLTVCVCVCFLLHRELESEWTPVSLPAGESCNSFSYNCSLGSVPHTPKSMGVNVCKAASNSLSHKSLLWCNCDAPCRAKWILLLKVNPYPFLLFFFCPIFFHPSSVFSDIPCKRLKNFVASRWLRMIILTS